MNDAEAAKATKAIATALIKIGLFSLYITRLIFDIILPFAIKDWSYLRTHLKLSENFKGKHL